MIQHDISIIHIYIYYYPNIPHDQRLKQRVLRRDPSGERFSRQRHMVELIDDLKRSDVEKP